MTFAKEAWVFVLPLLPVAVLALGLGRIWLGAAVALLAVLVLLFFRIPARSSELPERTVLAPANGTVTAIERVVDPEFAPGEYHRIVTFLSVFDVHVQRSPVAGEVVATGYRRGRKVAAFRSDAGEVNESRLSVIRTASGDLVAIRQIAGLVARRVVSYLSEGDRLERGQLVGLIRFGSRVDLYLPAGYRLLVAAGQRVREGDTAMAEAPRPEDPA